MVEKGREKILFHILSYPPFDQSIAKEEIKEWKI